MQIIQLVLLYQKNEVIRLHKSIPSNILLVYDAAYSEFITHHDYIDGSELVNNNKNVIMLRTFSKYMV